MVKPHKISNSTQNVGIKLNILLKLNQILEYFLKGTAGVWRIQAIKEAGGWKDRTTVEDMDLAVRASLKGWKFVFVGDVGVR